jgi:hypothetical protein
MKTLIFILALILNFGYTSAQEKLLEKGMESGKVEKGTYYKTQDNLLNKFIGVWQNEIDGKTFSLKIYKEKTLLKSHGVYIDVLKGLYCYSTVKCNFDNLDASLRRSESPIEMLEKGKVEFRVKDIKLEKLANVNFEILDNGSAKWVLFSRF